ncbi:diadenosine tetraphosphate hydrolase [Paenibacillus dendritiformis]|uniref:HIT family protein n=1 Tax=Paenibacillus dendritiformis TaxID=130049 RepID=UPI0018CD85E7|nr:diadenosine tetraphosphate hydrolase [Paenibacillus dendritiformis]MBG9792430.1 diadenosine tetraphosphate hydrolase [Paenibacillus dendritiformis]
MGRAITLADGPTVVAECLSCALTSGQIEPHGGTIAETEHFHAHQDVAYPIPGLVIVAAKRHFYGRDEMTAEERSDFIAFVHNLRTVHRRRMQMESVYYFYNEDTSHHFHLWMVPRYEWMQAFGRSVESLRPVLRHARDERNDEANRQYVLKGIETLGEGLQKSARDSMERRKNDERR